MEDKKGPFDYYYVAKFISDEYKNYCGHYSYELELMPNKEHVKIKDLS